MTTYRKRTRYTLACIFLFLFTACSGWCISFENEENIHISNLHRIDDDLFAWGSNVTVDGLIEGDLITGGYTVNTNGHTRGSENVFAFKFHHTGRVDGALRGLCNLSEVDGYVGRSVLLYGNDIRIGEKAVIEKDVVIGGAKVHFDGMAKGNAEISGESIYLSGIINGDVLLRGDNINVLAPAVIKGNLTYLSPVEASLELDSGVIILGETDWRLPDEKDDSETGVSGFTSTVIEASQLLAAFLFGIILLLLFHKYALEAANQLRSRFAVATATGLLSLIIVVVSVLILVLSVIFVLIGLTLARGDAALLGAVVLALSLLMVPITGFITVSGGVLFYSGKVIFALLTGYLLLRIIKPKTTYLSRFQLLLGLIVLWLIFAIPFVGLLIYFLVSIVGAGAIVLGVKYCRKELNHIPQPSAAEPEAGPAPDMS
jgi:cytoskeletal protein CcmA (bactofilin family)